MVNNETADILKELSENRYKEVALSEGVVVIALVIMRGHPLLKTIKGVEKLFARFDHVIKKYKDIESAAEAYKDNRSKVTLPAIDAATVKVIVAEYSVFSKDISQIVRQTIQTLGTSISLVGV